MRRIYLKSVSFVPFRPVTLGFYFIPSRYSYLSRFNMNTDDALQKKVEKRTQIPSLAFAMLMYAEYQFNISLNIGEAPRSYWSGNVEMDYTLNFVSIELWIGLRQKSDHFK